MLGPIVRIVLRYGVGAIIGWEAANSLAADPDVVALATAGASIAVGIAVEGYYALARRFGWPT